MKSSYSESIQAAEWCNRETFSPSSGHREMNPDDAKASVVGRKLTITYCIDEVMY